MPEDMPEDMPDRMPEDLPDRMPEDMPDHMPEDMLDRMPNRMSEDMSDRMPEDLPARTCINVMVGITRSKVILRSGSPTPRYVRCCFASGSKNHGIYSVFVPVPSKNTGIPSFHHVARCSFYVRKRQPYCILRSFSFPNTTKNRQKIVQKRSQIDFQKQLIISASLFPHHHRHRRI